MLNKLSKDMITSLNRSVSVAFQQYMENIQWDKDQFNIQDFFDEWQGFVYGSSWYKNISSEMEFSTEFHEQVVAQVSETIGEILDSPVTKSQIREIIALQKELGGEYQYSCNAEAVYVIKTLKAKLAKQSEMNRNANEKELKIASLLYYQKYEQELPLRDYSKQEIDYIIEQLRLDVKDDQNRLHNSIIH